MPEQAHRVIAARDTDAVVRILVVAPEPPRDLLDALLQRHPSGRVTLLATRPVEDLKELGRAGVETAGPFDAPAAWLRARRFHHTAVVAVEDPTEELATALEEHQPQAPVLRCRAADQALPALERIGVLPERSFGSDDAIG